VILIIGVSDSSKLPSLVRACGGRLAIRGVNDTLRCAGCFKANMSSNCLSMSLAEYLLHLFSSSTLVSSLQMSDTQSLLVVGHKSLLLLPEAERAELAKLLADDRLSIECARLEQWLAQLLARLPVRLAGRSPALRVLLRRRVGGTRAMLIVGATSAGLGDPRLGIWPLLTLGVDCKVGSGAVSS